MGASTRPRVAFTIFKPRAKAVSSLTFSKNTSSLSKSHNSSPAAAAAKDTAKDAARPKTQSNASQTIGRARFERLTQSVDSLQQLKVGFGSGCTVTNFMALHENNHMLRPPTPSLLQQQSPRPATPSMPPVTSPRGGTEGAATAASSLRPTTPGGTMLPPPPGSAPPQPTSSEGAMQLPPMPLSAPPPARLATPLIDLSGDAMRDMQRPGTGAVGDAGSGPSGRPLPAQGLRPATSAPRFRAGNGMGGFKPTRGHALVVFQVCKHVCVCVCLWW